jgi:hypothetical protein
MEGITYAKRTTNSNSRCVAKAAPLPQGKKGIGPDLRDGNAQSIRDGLARLGTLAIPPDGGRDGLLRKPDLLGDISGHQPPENQLRSDLAVRPAGSDRCILFHGVTPSKGGGMRSREYLENIRTIYVIGTGGEEGFGLHLFGDHLAKREGYKNLDGMEAVHFYLIQKFHWLPAHVRAMSYDDLRFVLHQEMQGWTWPEEACALGTVEFAKPGKPIPSTGRKV